jgi:CRISPR-associated protein Cas5d
MGYGIVVRVQGDYACFTRPEMKVERVSYDVLTPSAARGIIEAIYWKPAIRWVIDQIHVLNPIKFTNIRRNEVSEKIPESVPKAIQNGSKQIHYLDSTAERQQRAAMVLKDVDYVIQAHFDIVPEKAGQEDTIEKHYNIALRRFRKGQYYHTPSLGTREFGAKICLIENKEIPVSQLTGKMDLGWMLYDLDFSNPENIEPKFFKAVMQNGIIELQNISLVG